ncbi:PH domain-containing protein [Chryseobacterium gambrini]|uniref:PH domain-containing protein n=1 Tax=Chryseobacterium gambrini TaxID=373672 RepID=A0AAJ1R389_9FLAO|nr:MULTISPECIES: PH domain-containing protein [Chryseobacterium]MDN4012779.1 PH domain-containing protein [Chryseobacterium gambrini]MDN4030337.1 PH domain-containing protein [Chryseobacterium gambrini]QWA39378.1 PH domain-containing protein [Chryseobacterium sp. ZHDP1]
MNNHCGLCGKELTSIDMMLGENKLSDGNIICNSCLEKASVLNEELLSDLHRFSLKDIESLLQNGEIVQQETIQENISENVPAVADSERRVLSKDLYKRRLKEIKNQMEGLRASLSMFTKGEIKELPYILDPDEVILAITDAQFAKTTDAGILLTTPKRMISVSKAMFSPAKVNEFLNEDILEVSFVKNFVSPNIRIHTKDKMFEFESFFNKDYAEDFYQFISKIYNREDVSETSSAEHDVISESVLEQLEKLGKLRENGILTEEEFTLQKKKLLEKL